MFSIVGSIIATLTVFRIDAKVKYYKILLSVLLSAAAGVLNAYSTFNGTCTELSILVVLFVPIVCTALFFNIKDVWKNVACSISFGIVVDVIVYTFEATVGRINEIFFDIKSDAWISFAVFILVLCVYFIVKKRTSEKLKVSNIGIPLFLMIVFTVVCFMVTVIEISFSVNKSFDVILVILTLLSMIILLPYVIGRMLKSQYSKDYLEQKLELQLRQYEELQKKDEDLRHLRHDYTGHLLRLSHLLKENQTKESLEYVESLGVILKETELTYSTGNSLLDSILSDKSQKIVNSNIKLEFDGLFPKIGIDNIDVCSIFDNALNNALEASVKTTVPSVIKISSKIIDNRVWVRVSNPMHTKAELHNNSVKTTKKDKSMHGFGIPNIKKAVMKYDGKVKLLIEDNQFILMFDLKLAEK